MVKNLFWLTLIEGLTLGLWTDLESLKYNYDIYFPVVSLLIMMLLYILQQYFPPLCSYYLEKEGS